jgi:protein-L-isoaspartate(D-aspartate) O-methyltransferase
MSFFFCAAVLHRRAVAALRAGVVCMVCAGLGAGMNAVAADSNSNDARRARMVDEVAQMVRDTARETGRSTLDARVMAALGKVERHRFMPPAQSHAYENRPLPIGYEQTISQPYIVALMTDLLNLKPGDKVLEVGTGLGYQAAVLAELARAVYTIEIVEPLGRSAAGALAAAGYWNVQPRIGDGYLGWPEAAPFDAIIVTAAAPHVPKPLIDQLKPGGQLVIPLGERGAQSLYVVEKDVRGGVTQRKVIDVRFVPFTGDAARRKP